jgi:hypothetical protein
VSVILVPIAGEPRGESPHRAILPSASGRRIATDNGQPVATVAILRHGRFAVDLSRVIFCRPHQWTDPLVDHPI